MTPLTYQRGRKQLRLRFYPEGILRVSYHENEKRLTDAVLLEPLSRVQVDVKESKERVEVHWLNLRIEISKKDLSLRISDQFGLVQEDQVIQSGKSPAHERERTWEKGIYGLGEKYHWLNLMHHSFENWNTDVMAMTMQHNSTQSAMHTAVNFYMGLNEERCVGWYYDNPTRTRFSFDQGLGENAEGRGLIQFAADGGFLDYYLIAKSTPQEVVEAYGRLTGTSPLWPRKFLGYQQSRYSYKTQEELLAVAKRFRQEEFPCDVLYLDIHYMDEYRVFSIDKEVFPDFVETIRQVHKMGFEVIVIVDPGVKVEKNGGVGLKGAKAEYFIQDPRTGRPYIGVVWPGKSVFPDFLQQKVRDWWGSLHKAFVDAGIRGIWNDMNEIADFSTRSKTVPKRLIHKTDEGEELSQAVMHNQYAHYEAMATQAGMRKLLKNQRPFVLSRAACAGTQRLAAIWTGDNTSTWEHMEMSIPMFLNLGLSGFSLVGSDVGGYAGNPSAEMMIRWMQLGAFTPLFRNHAAVGTRHQEPWCFGAEALQAMKQATELRYRLRTYTYSALWQSHQQGIPIMRPLFFLDQTDANLYHINDQFLYGDHLMVCPVLRPGQHQRMVVFPRGEWVDFFTGERHDGGKAKVVQAGLGQIPIFVRAGAVIPLDPLLPFDPEGEIEHVELLFFEGEEKLKTKLYFDDGQSLAFESGYYRESWIHVEDGILREEILHDRYGAPLMKIKNNR